MVDKPSVSYCEVIARFLFLCTGTVVCSVLAACILRSTPLTGEWCTDIACATAIDTVKGAPGKYVIKFFVPHEDFTFPLDDLLAWRDTMHEKHWVASI
jgi:hypothetical protein